ncbi:MAG: DUF5107 domain-containing protein [Bacteroidetes bacterium]|nr:MAG: DUF5107 domain-containing protein [Bacteroidota bacterium]
MKKIYLAVFCMLSVCCKNEVKGQEAKISESMVKFKTYPFSDPDPVAKFTNYYPYFRFDEYQSEPSEKEWKIVTLENDYIKVYVAPEIGGKVLGAIDKQSGEEFIYFNKVVKFRDIAMRGAWTSGGIEFNFGSIGHAPTTASPVNYLTRKNADGSVSCFVGAPDITSRTEWRVEIRLPANTSYFETNAIWYNPSELKTSLYNWMTASVDATGDLKYYFPGHTEIGHGGEAGPWPFNRDNIDISEYKNNNFGGSKSYHVLGEYADHFLCYFHNKNFGLGHLSAYDEKPGQKIWIWALSREGGIWEDLLTDPGNVQYTEIQTGLLFNQAGENSIFSPYKHLFFDESDAHRFSEKWFPVKGIGGMVTANEFGALNVEKENGKMKIGLCALQNINADMEVSADNVEILRKPLSLKPGEYAIETMEFNMEGNIQVKIGDFLLYNSIQEKERKLSKPVTMPEDFDWNSEFGMISKATELEKQRHYRQATAMFEDVLKRNSNNIDALTRLAGLYYREMNYEKAAGYALKALSINTYEPEANYIFGLISKKLNKKYDALDGFSVAARSNSYRSAANAQLASLFFNDGDLNKSLKYANQALDYNRYNLNALKIKVIVFEKTGEHQKREAVLDEILETDPLNTFANFEKNAGIKHVLNYEMPHEICIEQAIWYAEHGLNDKAVKMLEVANPNAITFYWLYYLLNDKIYLQKALELSPELVFPSRPETYEVLIKALQENNHWKTKYYLGLILASKGRLQESQKYFSECGFQPDFYGFYLTRYDLMKNEKDYDSETDLKKAYELAPDSWRVYKLLAEYFREKQKFDEALNWTKKGTSVLPSNFVLSYQYAVDLVINDNPEKAFEILTKTTILPNEGASSGRTVYRQACILSVINQFKSGNLKNVLSMINNAREWPENLGVGKPYVTDERIEDYLEMLYWQKKKNNNKSNLLKEKIIASTLNNKNRNPADYLGVVLLKNSNRGKDANQIIDTWRKVQKENLIASWCLAKVNDDEAGASKIMDEIVRNSGGTLYNQNNTNSLFGLVHAISELNPD